MRLSLIISLLASILFFVYPGHSEVVQSLLDEVGFSSENIRDEFPESFTNSNDFIEDDISGKLRADTKLLENAIADGDMKKTEFFLSIQVF